MPQAKARPTQPAPAVAIQRDGRRSLARDARLAPDHHAMRELAEPLASGLMPSEAGSSLAGDAGGGAGQPGGNEGSGAGAAHPATLGNGGPGAGLTGGARLADEELQFFNDRMGRDFDRVRVHTGPRAEAAARRLGANAYTVGRHVVFGRGKYRPGTPDGRRLLGHELAHVVQQGAAPPLMRSDERDTGADVSPSLRTPGAAIQGDLTDALKQELWDFWIARKGDDVITEQFQVIKQSNTLTSSALTIPPSWDQALNDFAKARPEEGKILLHGRERQPEFRRGGWIMLAHHATAMTMDDVVFVAPMYSFNIFKYVHELVHVHQFGSYGVGPFLVIFFGMGAASIAYHWARGEDVMVQNTSFFEWEARDVEDSFSEWYFDNYSSMPTVFEI